MLQCSHGVKEVAHPFSGDGAILIHWQEGQDPSYFVCTVPLEKVHRRAWIYPIHSWVAKTLSKIHNLLLFVYLSCSFSKDPEVQTHLERRTSKEHQGKGSVCRQKMHKVIKWLVYNPKISQGQGHNQGCTGATTFIYPHSITPLYHWLVSEDLNFSVVSYIKRWQSRTKLNNCIWAQNVRAGFCIGTIPTAIAAWGECVCRVWQQQLLQDRVLHIWLQWLAVFLSSKPWQRIQGAPLRPRLKTFCSTFSKGLCSCKSCSTQLYWNFLPLGHRLCPVKAKHSANSSWEAHGLFQFTQGPSVAAQLC